MAEAVKRRSFKRAFKTDVEVSPGLAEMIDGLMEKDALQALSLANKAGLVVAGATKVEGSIGPTVPAALVSASDGSADGVRKMEAAIRRLLGDDADSIARIRDFRSGQLDFGLGTHKCDTRGSGRGVSRRRLRGAGAATATLPRGTGGSRRDRTFLPRPRLPEF